VVMAHEEVLTPSFVSDQNPPNNWTDCPS
jgi:hypothetical protein